ncbi:hypothetical protein F7Q99_09545 [Streptomyces kaniharaensis]|uniref:Uncharacterized protein n=1 Tax=Streptomyces kaniharaensis TaxID=212423 RepID=A0A6N7KLW4_9ACTN|nr:hypothetical protein [Streptomyces kaniharaensis]MQS12522.1 hypothetical protein [Streptomyces kaniharaensis]
MKPMEPGTDDAEVTYEQVVVLSLAEGEPAGPVHVAVRVFRESMMVKRVAGYWVRWDERWGPDDIRHHARWVPDEEYVRPAPGRPDGTLTVTVAAYWTYQADGRPQRRTSETVIAFRPGETEHELVLERPDPHHPAALTVHLADARWMDGGGGREIHYGYAGATEAEDADGGEGDWLVRFPEYVTGLLPHPS